MRTVLSIAGFDPSSGAGITADLMVFAAHRLYGTSAITALTVQSTTGVRSTQDVDPRLLRETLACLQADLPPAGIKIGMLATAANIAVVCDALEILRSRSSAEDAIPVVLDPVLRSSTGRELLEPAGVVLLRERLLPLVDWVTPNIDELAVLTGETLHGRADLPVAAHLLQTRTRHPGARGRLGVLATGGHLDPPDDLLLTPSGDHVWLPGLRVETRATHGTGCAFSSAFLSNLVLGLTVTESAQRAKAYVAQAMQSAELTGTGPCRMNHLWPLLRPEQEVDSP